MIDDNYLVFSNDEDRQRISELLRWDGLITRGTLLVWARRGRLKSRKDAHGRRFTTAAWVIAARLADDDDENDDDDEQYFRAAIDG